MNRKRWQRENDRHAEQKMSGEKIMDARTERMIETKMTAFYVCDATVQLLQARIALDEMQPLERLEFMKAYGEEMCEEMARVYRRAEELESALAEAGALLRGSKEPRRYPHLALVKEARTDDAA
jgi:hypothetical protein